MNELAKQHERPELGKIEVNCPVVHRFAPNVYLREIEMPSGTFVVGHKHKTDHFNIVLSGSAYVALVNKDNVITDIQYVEAPLTFASDKGMRKVLYIMENMKWQTIHPVNVDGSGFSQEEGIEYVKLIEDDIIDKSETIDSHRACDAAYDRLMGVIQ